MALNSITPRGRTRLSRPANRRWAGVAVALALIPWSYPAPAGPSADAKSEPSPTRATAVSDPIAQAMRMVADCQARYRAIQDYTCTFYKRERIDGKLIDTQVMAMKARTSPFSLYFKCAKPNAGREAIWIKGRNGGKIVVHDAGITKVIAGTVHLDPKGGMAMEDNRHPISDAGIGALIDTVRSRWEVDLKPALATVSIHPQARVGDHPCVLIETTHPARSPGVEFHKVRLYIDAEHGLPIRFEAYDWPTASGREPLLVEEYTYLDLKVNVGLQDRDFDPKNSKYSFGRF